MYGAVSGTSSGLGNDISMEHVEVLAGTAHVILQVLPLRIPRKVAHIHARPRNGGGALHLLYRIWTQMGIWTRVGLGTKFCGHDSTRALN